MGQADGSIVGWGSQVVGVDLTGPFVAIAAGEYHSLGLKFDGSIVAWGYNDDGQCNVPAPNMGFAAVAGWKYHSLGLKSTTHTLTVGVNDADRGTVSVLPYLTRYPHGMVVTLTAEPNEGRSFNHWKIYDPNHSGDDDYMVKDSNNPITIVMDTDRQIKAAFNCASGVGPMLPMMLGVLGLLVVFKRRR